MSKFVKYAIASDGRLVYRANGNTVRAMKTLEIRGNRVYVRGRLHGYIGKGTVKQQKQIEKRAQNRITRARKKAERELKSAVEELTSEESVMETYTEKDNGWDNLAVAKRAWFEMPDSVRDSVEVSIAQRSLMNYASALRTMVDEGYCTVEGANTAFSEFEVADGPTRSRMWDELHK